MPWDENDTTIKSNHKSTQEFQPDTLHTVSCVESVGVQAIIGKSLGKTTMEIQSYLFSKEKGWTLEKAKEWFNRSQTPIKEHLCAVLPFIISEKLTDKPLKIKGLAMTTGLSRNLNIYTPEELQTFAGKLVDAPVYIEHVTAEDSVGKVTATNWDGQNLFYEAEIYDEETAVKIRKGLIRHVSVGADYEALDLVSGKVPHGLYNAELSLVAVPGIADTNIQVLEKLDSQHQNITQLVEELIKKPSEPTIPVSQVIKLIEQVLPSNLVKHSWSLGPQRMCQELCRVIIELRRIENSHGLIASN